MMSQPSSNHRLPQAALSVTTVLAVIVMSACGGGGEQASATKEATPAPAPAPMTFDPADITPQMVALGDSIFHGLVAVGTCQSCHGPDAKGPTGIAPDLTDQEWLHSDGSWQGIFNTVQSGVLAPKKFPGAMLPMGGSGLTPEQLRAVSAYVYSLSHKVGA